MRPLAPRRRREVHIVCSGDARRPHTEKRLRELAMADDGLVEDVIGFVREDGHRDRGQERLYNAVADAMVDVLPGEAPKRPDFYIRCPSCPQRGYPFAQASRKTLSVVVQRVLDGTSPALNPVSIPLSTVTRVLSQLSKRDLC